MVFCPGVAFTFCWGGQLGKLSTPGGSESYTKTEDEQTQNDVSGNVL
jgi:hypothetical protein